MQKIEQHAARGDRCGPARLAGRDVGATRAVNEDVGPALNDALAQAERTLASANALVGPDSPVNSELRRALVELTEAARALGLAADQIEHAAGVADLRQEEGEQ